MKEIAFKYIGYLLLSTVAWVAVVNIFPEYQTWWMLVIALPIAFWWYLVLSGLTKKKLLFIQVLKMKLKRLSKNSRLERLPRGKPVNAKLY